jgi:hypothetical protein
VCDIAGGEDCRGCPDDCNGKRNGRPSGRYCCGVDADCGDARCTSGGATCVQGAALGPQPGGPGASGMTPTFARVQAAKRRSSERLLALPDVVGHGIGLSAAGEPVIEVYLGRENAESRARIPAALDGIPVRVVVTGRFVAY